MILIEVKNSIEQLIIDKLGKHTKNRWITFLVICWFYIVRVFLKRGFVVISYLLFMYLLQAFILWGTPKGFKIDLFNELNNDGINQNNLGNELNSQMNSQMNSKMNSGASAYEFMDEDFDENINFENDPFIRNLPEYSLWLFCMKSILIALFFTFFNFLDIPVFTPLLVIYSLFMVIYTFKKLLEISKRFKYKIFGRSKDKSFYSS